MVIFCLENAGSVEILKMASLGWVCVRVGDGWWFWVITGVHTRKTNANCMPGVDAELLLKIYSCTLP